MPFAWFGWRRAADRAIKAGVAGSLSDCEALLQPLTADQRAGAWTRLSELLIDSNRTAEGRKAAERALKAAPDHWNALVALATLDDREDPVRALTSWRRLHELAPGNLQVSCALAERLWEAGEDAPALAILAGAPETAEVALLGAKILLGAGRTEEALAPLDRLIARADGERRMFVEDRVIAPAVLKEAESLRDSAIAQLEGAEQVVLDHALRGNLAVRSGVNHSLLAASKIVAAAAPIAASHALLTPDDTWSLGQRLLAEQGRTAVALCQLGAAELRRGKPGAALEHFEEARSLDVRHFGAELGYGAALSCREEGWLALLAELPLLEVPEDLSSLVPEWPVLGELERKVVVASLAPFARAVRALAGKGRRMHLLPVDLRVTDVPELASLEGARHDEDHRAYAALGGVAGHEIGCVKIEKLLNVSASGWTFAHEFAHLAEQTLSERQRAQLIELHERACDAVYAFHSYQLTNPHEFFAVAYTDLLFQKYDIPSELHFDDEGHLAATLEFISDCT